MLKPVLKTESEIPDGLKEHYKEKADGSFLLQLEGGVKTQADVDRVKESLKKEREKNEELTKKVSKLPNDFDPEKWEALRDFDPDNLPTGDFDKDSKEFQQAVAQAVRAKEKEIKDGLEKSYKDKLDEVDQKEKAVINKYKEGWIKQQLSEQFGFTDPKRLRWLMLDIHSGQHPEFKKKLDSINVEFEGGVPKIIGGDLKDAQGAVEILENIASDNVSCEYKPASSNSGGGANPKPGGGVSGNNPFSKEHWNLTKQAQIEEANPEEAKRLAAQVGIEL